MSQNPYQPYEQQYPYRQQPYETGPYQQGPYSGGGYPPAPSPGHGYGQAAADGNSAATLAIVFGVVGIVLLPILAPLAIWQANKAEKLGVPATAGKVLGWVGVALLIVYALMVVAFLVFFAVVVDLNGVY